jgi:ABC-2 type transport system ATP-binding protein
VRQLSLGQRMRGDLAAALLHDPEVLYLDEPTIGLDVVAKQRIRDFLLRLNQKRDLTVLLTTHDMTDIAQLCQRMMLIDRGRLLYDGPLEQIRERYGRHRTLVIDLQETLPEAAVRTALTRIGLPSSVFGVREGQTKDPIPNTKDPAPTLVRSEHQRHWIRFDRATSSAADLIAAVCARLPVIDLAIEEPEIEGIIARIYREGL